MKTREMRAMMAKTGMALAILGTLAMTPLRAQAAQYVCSADCVVVSPGVYIGYGTQYATSARSKVEAFALLRQTCQRLTGSRIVNLAKYLNVSERIESSRSGSEYDDRGHSNSGWYQRDGRWYSAGGWEVQNYHVSGQSYEYSNSSERHLELVPARVLDPEICGPYEEDPEVPPVYVGPPGPLG